MTLTRFLVLALLIATKSAAAESVSPCNDRFTDASAHYRDALYQSDPRHRDSPAAQTALRAFRSAWDNLIEKWPDCPPNGHAEEGISTQRLYAVGDIAAKAAVEADLGRPNQAYQTLMQIRSLLADMRHAERIESYSDPLDAFDDKLAEADDDELDDGEISPDQFVVLCEQVGVLEYLGEKLEKLAPAQWAADSAFLDALENLARQIRGLKITIIRGESAPIHAALSDLRRAFDRFYLLYG
jgi:hypothetical protein